MFKCVELFAYRHGSLKLVIRKVQDFNNLSGLLPTEYFNNFKAMMSVDKDMDYMRAGNFSTSYVYSVTMRLKGLEIEFTKIQIALTILDLSSNKFKGKIPESLGKLKSLIQLNLSHNSLIGYIQPSLGNLTNLESLDLSSNMLAGRIPQQLVDLTFLEVLNLSYNQLEGSIPIGKQFNTFEHGSYEGNLRLCGFPLKVKCNNGKGQQLPPSNFEKEDSMFEEGFGWKAVAMGYGCGFYLLCFLCSFQKCEFFSNGKHVQDLREGRKPDKVVCVGRWSLGSACW